MSGIYVRRVTFAHRDISSASKIIRKLNHIKDLYISGCNIIDNIYILSQTSNLTTLLISEEHRNGNLLSSINNEQFRISELRIIYTRWRSFLRDTSEHWKQLDFIHGDLSAKNIIYDHNNQTFCAIDFYDGVVKHSGIITKYFERQHERLRWIQLDQYMQKKCLH